ncbi:MAG: NYN domain-containing protein [Anaerolineae bacterium]|nr:NYN domain-containing protein [Anaerolineae bacterium]
MLLIDGHNLINALPDIMLDDPNDEALLVEKLKSYCGRTGKRCLVVFDHGLPGGQSRDLSTPQVQVIFAAAFRTNADRVLRERIRKHPSPGEVTVVSSDHEVRAEAVTRRMRVLTSEAFAGQMISTMAATPSTNDDVLLSDDEVSEWMRLFGLDDGGS